MRSFILVAIIGATTWFLSYYPWGSPDQSNNYQMMMEKSLSVPLVVVDGYAELKFWAEKAGQAMSAVGVLGTIMKIVSKKRGGKK
jgi:hypothetical protein